MKSTSYLLNAPNALLISLAASATLTATAQAQEVAEATTLNEVVVTAQKRQERLQDVPVAVTALSADNLIAAGAISSLDLTTVTPGLNMTRNVTTAQPTIRGIGGRNTAASDEGTVPIYIDGVYQSMMQTGFFSLSNIERIEVLKGPQGTLFGRNAMGGAINVITTRPGQEASAKIGLSYARFGAKAGDFYGNLPMTDTLAANLAVHADEDDGYVRDLATGKKDRGNSRAFSARAKALWAPTSDLELTFGAAHANSSDESAIAAFPLNGNTAARNFNPNVRLAGPFQTDTDTRPGFKVEQSQAFVNAALQLNPFDVSFLASYEDATARIRTDYDATSFPVGYVTLPYGSEAYTSELRATSKSDSKLKWIGGVFYYSQKGYQGKDSDIYSLTFSPTAAITAGIIDTTVDSIAVFAEATYPLTERFSVTAGLRYTSEDRSLNQQRSSTPAGQPIIQPTQWAHGSTNFSKTSPRLTLQYSFADNLRTYLTYSEGFKSGVYNGGTFISPGVVPAAVQPETLKAVEAGIKSEPTRALRFNVALFHYDYENMQVSARNATGSTILQNAAGAENYGGEAELTWAITRAWNMAAGVSLQHARFTRFPAAQVFIPLATGRGNTAVFADVTGKAIPRSPDESANLSTDYTLPAWGGELTLSASYFWSSDSYWDLGNNFDNLGAHDNLNARAAWAPNENQRITVFGSNLTNSKTPIIVQPSAGGTYASFVKPWVVGLKYEYFWR